MVASRGPTTFAVTLITILIATVFVAARFVTRGWLVRSIKQDDWWILAAWILAVGFSTSICVAVHYGLGTHALVNDTYPGQPELLRKAQYAFLVLYNPCLMLTKTSIIIFYLSVMSKDVDPIFKWCNWICLAVVNVAGLALTFLNIFQCTPVRAVLAFPTPSYASCTNIVTLYLSSAPVNIVTDLAILFLPMPILTGMRLPKKQKIILVVTFSFGAFVAVVDVIRIAYLQSAARDTLLETGGAPQTLPRDQPDFPYYSSFSFMWSAVEINIGIVCACVPSLKPLFLRFLPQFVRDTNDISPNSSLDYEVDRVQTIGLKEKDENSTMLTNPAAFRMAAVKEYSGDDDGDNMGFLNMLAGPDDDAPELTKLARKSTRSSRLSRTSTAGSTASDFDFVQMDKSRNMLKLSNRQSVWPVAVVTVIFFLWGFAYGLLATLNGKFQTVAGLSQKQSLGLHASYFAAYLFGPLTLGRFILKRYGFKATMIVGLCIYGCGALVFWPSAVLKGYVAFIISNFIVAFGLSCLEVAANPYTALCGPLEYAEVRLNLSQAFQAVGSVLSPLLAERVLFKNTQTGDALAKAQWAYLGISLFVFLLAVVFYYIPLPEATDDQFEEQADKRSAVYRQRVGPYRVVWVTLALGVFSQWCYVGAQEAFANGTNTLMGILVPQSSISPSSFHSIGSTDFAIGRFLGAFLNYLLKPRWILLGCFTIATILAGLQMTIGGVNGVAINMLIYFFEASIFSIIYAMCMRGMGSQTKNASALMAAAISGGAIPPVITWAVDNAKGLQYSYCVVAAFYAMGTIFPLYLNLVPAAKKQVDPIHEARDRRRQARRQLDRRESGMSYQSVTNQFGIAGILARRKKQKPDIPHSQHVEQSDLRGMSEKSNGQPWDQVPIPSPVKMKEPQGLMGDLMPWEDSKSNKILGREPQKAYSSGSSSDEITPSPLEKEISQPREWTEEDDIRFDYHRALRGI